MTDSQPASTTVATLDSALTNVTSTLSTASGVKPGWQTTEFWLKLAAIVLTALYASGAIPTVGTVATVAAIAATMLGALGYAVMRSSVKKEASRATSVTNSSFALAPSPANDNGGAAAKVAA